MSMVSEMLNDYRFTVKQDTFTITVTTSSFNSDCQSCQYDWHDNLFFAGLSVGAFGMATIGQQL